MRIPVAEHAVDEALVRTLLEDQHRDLAALPIEFLAEGWDNTLWRLGDDLVARLPRRALGATLVDGEQRFLPTIAARLPLPIPVPLRVGVPGRGYPWRWSVVPFLKGTPAIDDVPVWRRGEATRFGTFLRALHTPAAPDAPANPFRGVPLAARDDSVVDRLVDLGDLVDRDVVRATWAAALAAPPWSRPAVWLHGDLHPGNVLADSGRIVGIIDFGDLTAGDPATDLAGVWLLFDREDVDAALRAYGDVDAALVARARGWATLFGLLLASAGLEGRPEYVAAGLATLAHLEATAPSAR